MPDKHRWMIAELRERGFQDDNCYQEDGVAVLVRKHGSVTGIFYAYWFERRWYLGSCARRGVTYLLPDKGNVVAACVAWAAGWKHTPPTEVWGAEAPPRVATRFGLKPLSRKEIEVWFNSMEQAMLRLVARLANKP